MLSSGIEFLDLLGRPFAAKTWSCWDLCREVYARGGIVLPEYPYRSDPRSRAELALAAIALFRRLDGPFPWAIAAITNRDGIIHTGIVLPDCQHLVHVREATGTIITPLTRLRHLISGYYVPCE
jgi:hypothetical protein